MNTELSAGAVVGGYRVEAVAGRGGMGVVYRATQLALERTVALKILAPELAEDEGFRARFQRESKLLAAIDHPNVITVHEAGEHEGRLFIVMRYVEGTDLRALIKQEQRLDPVRSTELLDQVARALDAAHVRGLIHRDVKPANVLIEKQGHDEHAYLSDFGLTKALGSSAAELTATGQWVGTVDYIAPEQAMGQPVDARADVYSLGCVLYSALTGGPVFPRDSEVAKIFAHVSDPPPPLPPELGLPDELDAVLQRTLAKDPDERFPSAGDLAQAARAAVQGEAPTAPERTVAKGAAAPTSLAATSPAATPPAAAPPASAGVARDARGGRGRRSLLLGAGALAIAIIAGAVILLSGGGGDDTSGAVDAVLSSTPVQLDTTPNFLAVGEGAVWAADTEDGTVRSIDLESSKPGKPIAAEDQPKALAAGEGSIFVASAKGQEVRRIDPASRRLRPGFAAVNTIEGGEIAVGEGAAWVTSKTDGSLVRLDPRTGKETDSVLAPEPGLDGPLAVGGGSVWLATNGDAGIVTRFDAKSLRVLKQVKLGHGTVAAGLAFGEGALWIADFNKNLVHRVDPSTNAVTDRIRVDEGISSEDVTVADGVVWVLSTEDDKLMRIDPKTKRVVGKARRVSTSEFSELVVSKGSAWVSDPDGQLITRLEY